jgi:putative inorganic carbon (HCO3(-)) transporter
MNFAAPVMVLLLAVYPLIFVPNAFGYTQVIRWLVLVCLSLIALVIMIKERFYRYDRAFLPLAIFLFFVFLSALFSRYPQEAWLGAPRFTGFHFYVLVTILFILAFNVAARKPEKIGEIIDIWLLSVGLIAIIGLLQYFGLNLVPWRNNVWQVSKSYSTIGNSNHFGTFLLTAFPFATIRFLHNQTTKSTIIFALIYGALLTSLCRGAWVGLAGGLVFLFFSYPVRKKLAILLLIMVMVTIVLAPVNNWWLIRQIFSFSDEVEMAINNDPEAGSWRFLIWQEAVKALPDSLIIGTGPETLRYIAPERFVEKFPDQPVKAHNIYLEIAVTIGIPALIAYLWFLKLIAVDLDRKEPLHFAVLLMIVIYLLQGIFLVDTLVVYPLFWILLGMGKGFYGEEC